MKPQQIKKIIARALAAADADLHLLMRQTVNEVAAARGLPPAWDTGLPIDAAKTIADALAEFGELKRWDSYTFGEAYTTAMGVKAQKHLGAYYTPSEVAYHTVRFSLGLAIDKLAQHPDPDNVLQVLATDPSCGSGTFLVVAARYIARRYVQRVTGLDEPAHLLIRQALPEVMDCCVFGVDIDPIAVDLAKSALWLEIDGEQPITFMDRNVIVGNVLEGDLPPRLAEIYPNPEGAFGPPREAA
ncbi:N-6 DNA methylase [[Actinomadura] parvosata]|uniref:N-6 DNA methylase n=1 Tax=[Actinomadura] parvosata TaxID=1955412 RepID=UPI00406C4571